MSSGSDRSGGRRSDRVPRGISGTAAAAVALALAVVLAAVIGVALVDFPRVDRVDNEWGTVTENRTEIETQIGIDNPTLLQIGESVLDLEYSVSLNDVRVAHGRKPGVDFGDSEASVVDVRTFANNDAIPEWWATHIERNGTTTVRVQPDAVIEPIGISLPMRDRTRTRTIRTDLLAPLRVEDPRRFDRFGRTLLVVNGTDARWGNVTANRTPIRASATVTNPTPVPIPVVDIGYTIRMNGITVGQGTDRQRTVIPPGETRTIDARAVIDTDDLDEWWVTHRRRNGTTRLTVDVYASVGPPGQRTRTSLDFLSFTRTFHTDFFGPEERDRQGDDHQG